MANELEAQFAGMQFILDKPHFEGQIYETADELGLCDEEREKWVKRLVNDAWKGRIERGLKRLREEYEENGVDRLRQLIGYVERFKENVNYGEYKEKGWPIGSGEIESSHKYVVQQRLKITGASWLEENLNPMVALRVVRANDWWEQLWDSAAAGRLAQRRPHFPHSV